MQTAETLTDEASTDSAAPKLPPLSDAQRKTLHARRERESLEAAELAERQRLAADAEHEERQRQQARDDAEYRARRATEHAAEEAARAAYDACLAALSDAVGAVEQRAADLDAACVVYERTRRVNGDAGRRPLDQGPLALIVRERTTPLLERLSRSLRAIGWSR